MSSCIAALQRALVSCVSRIPRAAFEPDADYLRRRGRVAGRMCVEVGSWEVLVADRVISWYEHVDRAHCRSWATMMQPQRGGIWLQVQRLAAQSQSVLAGALGLREYAGRPRTRWEEAVQWCRQVNRE